MHPSEQSAGKEKETTVEKDPGMRKQRLLKDDGRYIIFYDFEEQEEDPEQESEAH